MRPRVYIISFLLILSIAMHITYIPAQALDMNDFHSILEILRGEKGIGYKWYYNVNEPLPQKPIYGSTDILDIVQRGDIIYEPTGFYSVTGHIAIVEGIYYDHVHQTDYIRLIEANGYFKQKITAKVFRSVLDEERINSCQAQVYRVQNIAGQLKEAAVNFCIAQLGKPYLLDLSHDYSVNKSGWYCSALVWAAYMNSGIDIETTNRLQEPGVSPHDICNSSNVMRIY